MLPKTFTQSGYLINTRRPRGWQGYLRSIVALVVLLGGLGASQVAWGQATFARPSTISINGSLDGSNNTFSSTSYYANAVSTLKPPFSGAFLGGSGNEFDQSKGYLTLQDVSVPINYSSDVILDSVRLNYRVYDSRTSSPRYKFVYLTQKTNNGLQAVYSYTGNAIDLLNQPTVLGGGTYKVEVSFTTIFEYTDDPGNQITATDPSNSTGTGRIATFTVKRPNVTPTGGTTTWISTNSTDWSTAINWSNGVPTATSNAIIPTTDSIPNIKYPILNDANYNYEVKNLTLRGSNSNTAGQLILNVVTLKVYGNLTQISGGLRGTQTGTSGATDASKNSTIIFAGGNQTIQGVLVVSDIIIAGSGIKSTIDIINPTNILAFEPSSSTAGAILQTASFDGNTIVPYYDNTKRKYIQLGGSAIISAVSGQAETNTSYIFGVTRADRMLVANDYNTFGNIGLDLKANHTPATYPNPIYIYRVIGAEFKGQGTSKSVKRYYQISGDDNSNSSVYTSSQVDVFFHYLPSADELNGISEANLVMFRTTNNGVPFDLTGGSLDTNSHIFTRLSLPTLTDYTLTLGDKTNPLPVSLVAFGATRSGANALLSWTTASEEHNTGFNVQVSTDGVNFRTLSFVASQSPNSSTTLNYKYTDTESGKIGTRYYRLEQVDEGGAKNYSPVRILTFSGAAAGTGALVAYPNPFNEGVSLSFDGSTIADGTALVKLVDMTGRTVRESKLPLVGASLTLSDMSTLRSGLYLAKVTLPDGSTQTVRISKQ